MMKKLLTAIVVCLITLSAVALAIKPRSKQEVYIEKWAPTAVSEMYRSGIPASITLAQGMLESGNGLSELALKANNHFGIKCHNWKGKGMKFDDDRRGECFRVYNSADESYKDHSDFIRYRDRYKFLFEYEITDYKAWAHGLKKAGYATDPNYPSKLISLIETYELYRYDTGKVGTSGSPRHHKLPEPPARLERAEAIESFSFSLNRQTFKMNKVPFIYAEDGDTYSSIAEAYELFLREILSFNDLDKSEELRPGTIVYIGRKKKSSAKGVNKHIAEDGETLYGISQRYAVRLSSLLRRNGFASDYVLREGDVIKLR